MAGLLDHMKYAIGVIAMVMALACAKADAEDLVVGFSYAKPPYVFAQSPMQLGETRGIELDIVQRVLKAAGHTFKPRYFAYNNLHNALRADKVDMIATVRPEEEWPYYSEQFVYFQNFAITRKEDAIEIPNVEALASHTIAAWQGATKDLGAAFEQVVQGAPVYKEIGDQQQQVLLFLHGRVNVLVIDGAIFRYWARILGFDPKHYTYGDIFGGRTNFVAAFKSETMRNAFNKGLKALKQSGAYDQIYQKYERH